MPIPEGLTTLVHPWAALYADNKGVSDTVTFFHLGGLMLGGGAAVTMDRETLAARGADDRARGHILDRLRRSHRWVLIGLAVTFATGLLQVASDVGTFLPSGVFWAKMGLVAFLLANGGLVMRGEAAAAATGDWRLLRFAAVASLTLWALILLVGVILTSAA